jgi:hypothetical protein
LEQPLRSRLLLGAGVTLAAVLVVFLLARGHRSKNPEHAYPVPSHADRVIVEVLNGTSRTGLARVGTRQLRREGLDVVFFGNAEAKEDSTRVILRRGSTEDPAERVAHALRAGKIEKNLDTLRRVDVTVILGDDYRPPAELHP